jgi:hypothetical protein
LTASERLRIIAINFDAASEKIVLSPATSDSQSPRSYLVGRDPPAFAGAASRRQAITPLNGAFGERTLQSARVYWVIDSKKGGFIMANQIHWETSLTTAKARAKKEKKLILMDFYNNL